MSSASISIVDVGLDDREVWFRFILYSFGNGVESQSLGRLPFFLKMMRT